MKFKARGYWELTNEWLEYCKEVEKPFCYMYYLQLSYRYTKEEIIARGRLSHSRGWGRKTKLSDREIKYIYYIADQPRYLGWVSALAKSLWVKNATIDYYLKKRENENKND